MPCTLSISLVSLKDLPRLLLPPGQVLKIQQNPPQDQDTEQEPLQPSCTTTLTYETKEVKNVRLQAKIKGVFNSFYCCCYGNQSRKRDEYNLFTNDWTILCYHYSIICDLCWKRVGNSCQPPSARIGHAQVIHTSTGEHCSAEDNASVRRNSSYVAGSSISCFCQRNNKQPYYKNTRETVEIQ